MYTMKIQNFGPVVHEFIRFLLMEERDSVTMFVGKDHKKWLEKRNMLNFTREDSS